MLTFRAETVVNVVVFFDFVSYCIIFLKKNTTSKNFTGIQKKHQYVFSGDEIILELLNPLSFKEGKVLQ